MHNEIRLATAETATFLQNHLPGLAEDWWNKLVVDRLSFQQQRIITEKNLTTLRQLDFAGLLRVVDQNWYDLSAALNLPREGRNWVKELQTVRNKWAHASSETMPPSEQYRDADTLGRFLGLIGASQSAVSAVEKIKTDALTAMSGTETKSAAAANIDNLAPVEQPTNREHLFAVGEVVTLRSDMSVRLPILQVVLGGAEPRYRVFQDGKYATFYESQLAAVVDEEGESLAISVEDFRARLTALHLLSPSSANLFSLRSGRVNFVPYQYRPVLKLIRSDRPRLLIADEVGVGKTIEAGLILRELRARMDISSILVICPKALVAEKKWQAEMKRFDEVFTPLDGKLLRHCLQETDMEGEWPEQHAKAILPFSLFDSELVLGPEGKRRKSKGLLDLEPAPAFDLVIVDEAHHIRNPETFLHQGIRYFCDNAKAVVLMTATPVQLGSGDLFTLLNVLRPDLVIDRTSFEQMAEPNGYLNEAVRLCRRKEEGWQEQAIEQMKAAAQTDWGRLFLRETPSFQSAFDNLRRSDVDDAARVTLIGALEGLYTFSSVINRTRRRDIGEFTSRKPQTLTVPFTDEQQAFHDDLLGVIARILARCHGQQNVKFMMTTVRRQAASCLYGLAPMLRDILGRKLDQLEFMESTDSDDTTDFSFVEEVRAEIEDLIARAERLDSQDEKVEAFIRALVNKSRLDNNKALVFSTFRHTLAYLAAHMEASGLRYGLVHGDVPDDERADLRKRFSLPKDDPQAIDVLLSSEVGCEGLDFQFCDFLVNYDLPWNPMRIEQRIGRIDRYGQKAETVSIVNLVTPGTVDADIYQRCLLRIGVFQHAVGGSEEILGQITRQIHDIAESFTLTEAERAERLQQLADNGIRKVREEQELEDKQSELFGLNLPKQAWREEIEAAETFWLAPSAIQQCVVRYLAARLGAGDTQHIQGDRPVKNLRLAQEARNTLLTDFRALGRKPDMVTRDWERWLKGANPNLAVTFDQGAATDNPKITHLTLLHPLVRQAARYFEIDEPMQCVLEVNDQLPEGIYRFALYRWAKHGIRPDEELVAIAEDPQVEEKLLELLPLAVEPIQKITQSSSDFEALDRLHHAKWSSAQADHIAANQELAEHRMQSLTASHRARVNTLQDQLSKATNEKIRLMKQSELARAEADFDRRVSEIQNAGQTGDVRAMPVLIGTIVAKGRA